MLPLLALLGGGKTKIILIVLAIVAVVAGGYWVYQKVLVANLREEIATLQINNEKLSISNQSMQQEIERRAEETKNAYAEIERLSQANEASRTRLSAIQKKLRNTEKLKQADKIRNSRKADLLIKLMDKNVECYLENFDKVDGECIRGKWVSKGARAVPKITPEDLEK